MEHVASIIAALVEQPALSNAAIARLVGQNERRISRYRRLLAQTDVPHSALKTYASAELAAFFNPRRGARLAPRPDFNALRSTYPSRSCRDLWRAYWCECDCEGRTPLSYQQFHRLLRSAR